VSVFKTTDGVTAVVLAQVGQEVGIRTGSDDGSRRERTARNTIGGACRLGRKLRGRLEPALIGWNA